MSSFFLWGATVGFFTKLGATRVQGRSLLTSPWLFPKYMLYGGVFASYAEWIKRMSIEQLCQKEEVRDELGKSQKLNQIIMKPDIWNWIGLDWVRRLMVNTRDNSYNMLQMNRCYDIQMQVNSKNSDYNINKQKIFK